MSKTSAQHDIYYSTGLVLAAEDAEKIIDKMVYPVRDECDKYKKVLEAICHEITTSTKSRINILNDCRDMARKGMKI